MSLCADMSTSFPEVDVAEKFIRATNFMIMLNY